MTILKQTPEQADASVPIVTQLVNEDKVAWYKKPNLRSLYLILFPACMGIELTSGFDSQMINAIQIVPSWISCTFCRHHIALPRHALLTVLSKIRL